MNNKAVNGVFTYEKKIDPRSVFTRTDKSRGKEYAKKITAIVGLTFFTHVIEQIPAHVVQRINPETTIRLEAECFGPELTSVRLVYYAPNEMRLLTSVSVYTNKIDLKWNDIRKIVLAYNGSYLLSQNMLYKYLMCKNLKTNEIEYDDYIWDTYIESNKEKIYTGILDVDIVKDVTDRVGIKTCIEMIDDEIRYKITSQTYSEKYILSYVWVWFLSMYAEVRPEIVKNLTGYDAHKPNTPTKYSIQPVTIMTKNGQSTIGVNGYTLDVYDKDVFTRNIWSLTKRSMQILNVNNVHIGKNINPEGVADGICIQYSRTNKNEKIFVAKRIGRCDELPFKNMVITDTELGIILIEHYKDELIESGRSGSRIATMNWPKLRLMFFNTIQMNCSLRNIQIDFEYVKFDLNKYLKLHGIFRYEDEIRLYNTYAHIRIHEEKESYNHEYEYFSTARATMRACPLPYDFKSTEENKEEESVEKVLSEFMREGSTMTIFEVLVKTSTFSIDHDKLNSDLNDIIKTHITEPELEYKGDE